MERRFTHLFGISALVALLIFSYLHEMSRLFAGELVQAKRLVLVKATIIIIGLTLASISIAWGYKLFQGPRYFNYGAAVMVSVVIAAIYLFLLVLLILRHIG